MGLHANIVQEAATDWPRLLQYIFVVLMLVGLLHPEQHW